MSAIGSGGWVVGGSPVPDLVVPGTLVALLATIALYAVSRHLPPWPRLMRAGWGFTALFVLVVTLAPKSHAGGGVDNGVYCDFIPNPANVIGLWRSPDRPLNVLLFVPLGLLVVGMARGRARRAWWIAAVGLSVAVEAAQALLPSLMRLCDSADLFNNATGVGAGAVIGLLLEAGGRRLLARRTRPRATVVRSDRGDRGADSLRLGQTAGGSSPRRRR